MAGTESDASSTAAGQRLGAAGFDGKVTDIFKSVEAVSHRDSRSLLDFWHQRLGEGGIVVGRDIPSRSIARLLSNLVVYEPVDGNSDFRIRIAGAAMRRRFPIDVRGVLLSQLHPPANFAEYRRIVQAVVETGTVRIVDSRLWQEGVETMRSEIVILPVKAPDLVTTWVLVGLFRFDL